MTNELIEAMAEGIWAEYGSAALFCELDHARKQEIRGKARAALAAAEAAGYRLVPGWVPVSERLPKAGVSVLARCRDKGGHTHIIRAMYAGKHTLELLPSCGWWDECDHDEETDTLYVPPGWYENNRFEEISWRVDDDEVTHWMPLPAAPEAAK